MRKLGLLVVTCILSLVVTTSFAENNKEKRIMATGMQAVMDYNVDVASPQLMSFVGLSAYRTYTLTCTPSFQSFFPSDVNLVVWHSGSTFLTYLGGVNGTIVEVARLVPYYDLDYGDYTIKYQLSTNSLFSQTGTCVFR